MVLVTKTIRCLFDEKLLLTTKIMECGKCNTTVILDSENYDKKMLGLAEPANNHDAAECHINPILQQF